MCKLQRTWWFGYIDRNGQINTFKNFHIYYSHCKFSRLVKRLNKVSNFRYAMYLWFPHATFSLYFANLDFLYELNLFKECLSLHEEVNGKYLHDPPWITSFEGHNKTLNHTLRTFRNAGCKRCTLGKHQIHF